MKTNRLLIAISLLLLSGCAVAPPYDPGHDIPYKSDQDIPYDSGYEAPYDPYYVTPYDSNADYDPPYNSEIVPHKVGEPGGF